MVGKVSIPTYIATKGGQRRGEGSESVEGRLEDVPRSEQISFQSASGCKLADNLMTTLAQRSSNTTTTTTTTSCSTANATAAATETAAEPVSQAASPAAAAAAAVAATAG